MGNRDERIYAQIEGTADLYEPSVYSLLPLFQDFQRVVDARSEDYLPLTAVATPYSGQHKVFIIGLLPPSVTVTGRLLDRSASVAAITGAPTDADIVFSSAVANAERTASNTPSGSGQNPDDPAFWSAYVNMCARLGVKPENLARLINHETGFNPTKYAKNQTGGPVAVGLNQITWSTGKSIGMTPEQWASMPQMSGTEQLEWVEKSLRYHKADKDGQITFWGSTARGKSAEALLLQGFGGYNNQPGILYASTEYQNNHPEVKWTNGPSQNTAVQQNAGLVTNDGTGPVCSAAKILSTLGELPPGLAAQIENAKRNGAGADGGTSINSDAAPSQWKSAGSGNAQAASKENEKTANMDQNKTPLGEAFQAAQKRMINATLEALERIRNTPPLKLLVNPISFKVSSSKLIADGDRSRSQHIVEHWGEEQDKIDASGKLAAFFSSDRSGVNQATGEGVYTGNQTLGAAPGINRTARQYSKSYQNFLGLLQIYKNNGGLWLQDFYEETVAPGKGSMNLSTLGSVYIYYDNILYIGSFDTLSVTEADTGPYTLEYSFTFTVRATFLLDQVDDPNSPYNYGAGGLFSPQTLRERRQSTEEFNAQRDAAAETAFLNRAQQEARELQAQREQYISSGAAALDALYKSPDEVSPPWEHGLPPARGPGGASAVTQGTGSRSKTVEPSGKRK